VLERGGRGGRDADRLGRVRWLVEKAPGRASDGGRMVLTGCPASRCHATRRKALGGEPHELLLVQDRAGPGVAAIAYDKARDTLADALQNVTVLANSVTS
jgi:hypothetical protein